MGDITILGLYDYSLKWGRFGEFPALLTFVCVCFRVCVFFFFWGGGVFVREVGDVRWVPLLFVWKVDPNILRSGKKCRSPHPPPRPRTVKKCMPPPPPPMAWFGLTPMRASTMYNYSRPETNFHVFFPETMGIWEIFLNGMNHFICILWDFEIILNLHWGTGDAGNYFLWMWFVNGDFFIIPWHAYPISKQTYKLEKE